VLDDENVNTSMNFEGDIKKPKEMIGSPKGCSRLSL
jgi:hypothetical protein